MTVIFDIVGARTTTFGDYTAHHTNKLPLHKNIRNELINHLGRLSQQTSLHTQRIEVEPVELHGMVADGGTKSKSASQSSLDDRHNFSVRSRRTKKRASSH